MSKDNEKRCPWYYLKLRLKLTKLFCKCGYKPAEKGQEHG